MTTCFGPAPYSQHKQAIQNGDFHLYLMKLMLVAYLFVTNGLLFIEKLQLEIYIFNKNLENAISQPIFGLFEYFLLQNESCFVSHTSGTFDATQRGLKKSLNHLGIYLFSIFLFQNAINDYMFWTCTLFPTIFEYTKA